MNYKGCRRKCSGQIWVNVQECSSWNRKKERERPALVPQFELAPSCVRSTSVISLPVLSVTESLNLKLKLRHRFGYTEESPKPNVLIGFISTLNPQNKTQFPPLGATFSRREKREDSVMQLQHYEEAHFWFIIQFITQSVQGM